jgi:hypothetical protein
MYHVIYSHDCHFTTHLSGNHVIYRATPVFSCAFATRNAFCKAYDWNLVAIFHFCGGRVILTRLLCEFFPLIFDRINVWYALHMCMLFNNTACRIIRRTRYSLEGAKIPVPRVSDKIHWTVLVYIIAVHFVCTLERFIFNVHFILFWMSSQRNTSMCLEKKNRHFECTFGVVH